MKIRVFIGIVWVLMYTFMIIACNSSEGPAEKNINVSPEMTSDDKLAEDEGVLLVRTHCTGCHSEKIITQNRASREGWEHTIRWMQETQNLWDLGEDEEIILDYLAKNYAPVSKGRRAPLEVDWYELP